MASIEGKRYRILACRVIYRDSVYDTVDSFHESLQRLFSDSSCAFFGRQISVDPSGKASYDVVIDFYRRRQFSDVQQVFGLSGDDARVELHSYPGQGDYAFIAREVGNVCETVCGVGKSGLWFGNLHERVGVCLRVGRCVEDERVGSDQGVDGDQCVQSVVSCVTDGVSHDVQGVVDFQQYSEETVSRAVEVAKERLQLAELRFVHSLMRDRIDGVNTNRSADVCLVNNDGQCDVEEGGCGFEVPDSSVSFEDGCGFDFFAEQCGQDNVEEDGYNFDVSVLDDGFEDERNFDWFG